jgi:hypothetical protein
MTTYLATAPFMTAPARAGRLAFKKFIRRAFEVAGAPYADGFYAPL